MGRHSSTYQTNRSFCDKPENMAYMLLDILGTKLDIGPSQIRTMVAVAAIFQDGRHRLVKTHLAEKVERCSLTS